MFFALGKNIKKAPDLPTRLCLHLMVTGLKVLNLFYQLIISLPRPDGFSTKASTVNKINNF